MAGISCVANRRRMREGIRLRRETAVVDGVVDCGAVLVVGRLVWCSGTVLCLTGMCVAREYIGNIRPFARRSHDAVRLALALLVLVLAA